MKDRKPLGNGITADIVRVVEVKEYKNCDKCEQLYFYILMNILNFYS